MSNQEYSVRASVTLVFNCNAKDASSAYQKYINHYVKNAKLGKIYVDDESNIIVLDAEGRKVFDENEPIQASDDFTGVNIKKLV